MEDDKDDGALRAVLRDLPSEVPPAALEDDLRRTYRRRRRHFGRVLGWAALAASLLAAVGLVMRPGGRPPAVVVDAPPAPAASAAPAARPVPGPTPAPASSPTDATRSPTALRKHTPLPPVLVVEPNQAALLRLLARGLEGTRQVPPGAPALAAEVPFPDVRWEAVGDEWPPVYRPI
jgi:hypothetical protein